MTFVSFVEGPLLWGVFLIFIFGVAARVVFSILAAIRGLKGSDHKWVSLLSSIGRSLLPFHKAVKKRPVYAALRYTFHACLFVVPIFLIGHIVLWEESWFEWSWTAIPDVWADWMTLLLLALAAVFLIRRIFDKKIRPASNNSDRLFIVLSALPFLTGYLLAHIDFGPNSFFGDHLGTIHILTSEMLLLMVAFLFCRPRIYDRVCTGCAACEINCPTEALESWDEGNRRLFIYSLYRCISCGNCVSTCPEGAVELRHKIGLRDFFRIFSKEKLRSVELKLCERCGSPFAPLPQVEKITDMIHEDQISLCSNCKEDQYAETLQRRGSSL